MRVRFSNFEGVPGVLPLNFEGGPGVPLLNFEGVLGPGSWSRFYTMAIFSEFMTHYENFELYARLSMKISTLS